ncbi:hypothetical protein DdX_20280 [Ditylenchus destructor]|uniref:F-box domain-containing protein n=1 Tax=Ditylenchus destructor TaxID=166010 RepID=A0AAD4QWI1_9BILA|nr:hypothetical protein DdX_20280 [Ditylenchus destructor]
MTITVRLNSDILIDILRLLDRYKLDKISFTNRQFSAVIQTHLSSVPFRFLPYFFVNLTESNAQLEIINPNVPRWAKKKGNFEDLLPFCRDQSTKADLTILRLSPQGDAENVNLLEKLTHIWKENSLHILFLDPKEEMKLDEIVKRQKELFHRLFNLPPGTLNCAKLVLCLPDTPPKTMYNFKHYPALYDSPEVTFTATEHYFNGDDFIEYLHSIPENRQNNLAIRLNLYWKSMPELWIFDFDLFLGKIKQRFELATVPLSFRLVCYSSWHPTVELFEATNGTTSECFRVSQGDVPTDDRCFVIERFKISDLAGND